MTDSNDAEPEDQLIATEQDVERSHQRVTAGIGRTPVGYVSEFLMDRASRSIRLGLMNESPRPTSGSRATRVLLAAAGVVGVSLAALVAFQIPWLNDSGMTVPIVVSTFMVVAGWYVYVQNRRRTEEAWRRVAESRRANTERARALDLQSLALAEEKAELYEWEAQLIQAAESEHPADDLRRSRAARQQRAG